MASRGSNISNIATGVSSINSTPYSNHLASATGANPSYIGTVEKVDPYIEHDLKATADVPLKNFLAAFLNKSPEDLLTKDPNVERVANDPAITQMLDNYCSMKSTNETQRYGPFVELANEILTLLCGGKEPPIVFVKNHPHNLRGVRGNMRKLDVVVVSSLLDSVKNGKWKDYSYQEANTESDTRWTWADVIFAFEFKQVWDIIVRLIAALPVPSTSTFPNNQTSSAPDTQPNESLAAPDAGLIIPGVGSAMTSLASAESTFSAPSFVVPGLSASVEAGNSAVKPVGKRGKRGTVRGSQAKPARSTRKQRVPNASAGPSGIKSAPSSIGGKRGYIPEAGSAENSQKRMCLQTDDTSRTAPSQNSGSPAPSVKQVPSYPPVELRKQGARYAVEQISYSSNLRHVFNMLAIDGHIWICYYDHAGVMQSRESLNFVDDLYSFVLLLNGMMTMSKRDLGVLEEMPKYEAGVIKGSVAKDRKASKTSTSAAQSQSSSAPRLTISDHVVTFTGRLARIRPYGLLGRATEVDKGNWECGKGCVGDKCPFKTAQGRVVAVKRSWPAKTRKSEVEIIEEGQKALDDFELDEKCKKFKEDNGIDWNLSDCLPKVYISEDLDDLEKNGFRARINLIEFVDGVEFRVLRVIVFELLVPIYDLDDLEKFKQCFRDIFLAHHFLWILMIMHRDVSAANIMVRVLAGGKVRGVLNDWDLSKVGNSKDPSSNSRTGTRPFMAMDLLVNNPPAHRERFDWESMLYILIWIACRYVAGGHLVDNPPLQTWLNSDNEMLLGIKNRVITRAVIPELTAYYKPLLSWIRGVRKAFCLGFSVAADFEINGLDLGNVDVHVEQFDYDTLGGHVTFDILWAIYKK